MSYYSNKVLYVFAWQIGMLNFNTKHSLYNYQSFTDGDSLTPQVPLFLMEKIILKYKQISGQWVFKFRGYTLPFKN